MRTDGEHTWSVEIETENGTKRQMHRLDESVLSRNPTCQLRWLLNPAASDDPCRDK